MYDIQGDGMLNYRTDLKVFYSLSHSPPPSHLSSGTGKSLTCNEVAARTGLRPVDVGQLAKDNNFFEGWDEQYQCPILDEDKVQCGGVGTVAAVVALAATLFRPKINIQNLL